MNTLTVRREETLSPAYCSRCRGVLPFKASTEGAFSRETLECTRCRTHYRRCDPASDGRRRALRYLIYGSVAGMMLVAMALGLAALGPDHPVASPRETVAMWLLGAMTVGCIARSFGLYVVARDYESREPYELQELDRRLCIGMIREDVVSELSRLGWRPAKIRAAIAGLRPSAS